jgi:hypothetical protein
MAFRKRRKPMVQIVQGVVPHFEESKASDYVRFLETELDDARIITYTGQGAVQLTRSFSS